MRIARRQFRPCIADSNNGASIEQMIGEALVLHPASMNEAIPIRRFKPRRTAKFHNAQLPIFWRLCESLRLCARRDSAVNSLPQVRAKTPRSAKTQSN
jgi:hypothetical protein